MPTKRGKKWAGRVMINGKRKEKTFSTKKDALAWESLTRSKSLPPTEDGTTLDRLLAKYLSSCEKKGQSKGHLADKERIYTRFLEETGGAFYKCHKITYAFVQNYLDYIAETISPHRANIHRRLLVAAWNWGIRAYDLPTKNPFAVDTYIVDKKKNKIPTIEDFLTVVDSLQPSESRLLLTYLYTGARKAEILSLTWSDIDFQKGIVWLSTRKRTGGGLHRDAIPMAKDLQKTLQEQRLETGFRKHVFICPKNNLPYSTGAKVINRWCDQAGVPPFRFHAIRHLSASILASKGYALTDIQRMLRHQSITTTALYLQSLGFSGLDLYRGTLKMRIKKYGDSIGHMSDECR